MATNGKGRNLESFVGCLIQIEREYGIEFTVTNRRPEI